MNEAILIGIGSVAAVIIGAVVAGIIKLWGFKSQEQTKKSKEQQIAEKTAIIHWRQIADRQDVQILEQQKAIDHLHTLHARSLVREEMWYGWAMRMRDFCVMQAEAMKNAGIPSAPVPEVPKRDGASEKEKESADYVLKSQKLNTTLSTDVVKKLQEPNQ